MPAPLQYESVDFGCRFFVTCEMKLRLEPLATLCPKIYYGDCFLFQKQKVQFQPGNDNAITFVIKLWYEKQYTEVEVVCKQQCSTETVSCWFRNGLVEGCIVNGAALL